MQLLREMQQQLWEMRQQQDEMQHHARQQQSFQDELLKRQELEHLQAAKAREHERSTDLTATGKASGERASELQESSQQISMRKLELQAELGSDSA